MRARQSVLLDTARHVQGFLDDHAALLGPNIASSRRNLDDAVSQLTAMSITQTGGTIASRGATARQRSLRTSLRNNNMKPVAAVAKLMLPDVPEFAALTMPVKQLASTQLVAAAHAMADAAQLHEAIFTSAGMSDDFIAQLRAAADAVTTSLDARQKTVATSTSATSGLKAQETRVRNLFKLINALIVPKLGTDVVLLAQWKATKAIIHRTPIVPTPLPPATPPATDGTTSTGSTPSTDGSTSTGSTTPASTPAPVSTPTPAPAQSTAPAASAGGTQS
jgi:hypothetical protein